MLLIVTAYYPDPERWSFDVRKRKEPKMNCFLCKGKLVDGLTSYMADFENCIVIIKNVPCHRCTKCGEESFSGDIVQKIEKLSIALGIH